VVAKSVEPSVHAVLIDVEFVKEMLLGIARGWNGERVALEAILPAEMKARFESEAEAAVKALLAEGVEVGYSERVKSGFKVAPKEGGYYISFTDEDFSALLAEYLKEKVTKMLY
jgi:V/A-type H+-transporting ATPase subunit E